MKIRWVMVIVLVFALCLSLLAKMISPSVQERWESTFSELAGYHENNDTSLGSRISMWKAGLYAIQIHPFGQSAVVRYDEVVDYMDSNEAGNPEGKRNAVYHLHNDLIEAMSLQGIWGGFIFILFFTCLLYAFYKKNMLRVILPLFIIPVIFFGLVDSLFIDKKIYCNFFACNYGCIICCVPSLTDNDSAISP